jgi:hypothetical protein
MHHQIGDAARDTISVRQPRQIVILHCDMMRERASPLRPSVSTPRVETAENDLLTRAAVLFPSGITSHDSEKQS